MKRRKIKFPLVPVAVVALLSLILVTCFLYIGKRLLGMDFFIVKDVMVNEEREGLEHFMGRNIFDIDLKDDAEYLSELYPDYKKVRVIRVLPNRIYVDFVKRKAVAFVKHYRYFS
ncbi:hypothetical protein ACFL1K_04840, partial [Candidatus Omnitrophota bacterium]